MSFIHPLVHVNWAYCFGCVMGNHANHVPDDEEEGPCACACAGGPAPARKPLPPEPAREIDDDWTEELWPDPEPAFADEPLPPFGPVGADGEVSG